MSILEKAKLVKLGESSDDDEQEEIPVQFNPASLRLTLSNSTEGGQSTGRQQRQYSGNASTEISFDLVFDTADEEGEPGVARNVREKTAKVEQFVLAQASGGTTRPSPPRVKFVWGGLSIAGVMSQLAIDFDLFAPTGEPLRAKMSVSIKEQDAQYALLQSTSKANAGAPPQAAGSGGGAATPGSAGGGAGDRGSNRTGTALAGESAADFANRMGLPADAWRGVAAGLEGTLSLAAGAEIDFSASVSAQAGVGVSVGFQADAGLSIEAAVGLDASASVSAGAAFAANAGAAAGFALSAAGGVEAAVQTVAIARAGAASDAAAKAFGAAGAGAGAAVASGGGGGAASGPAAAVQSPASADSPSLPYAPPRADPRATTYGHGVPLRPRRGPAAAASAGVVALRPYARAAAPPVTRDPTTPAWAGLPVLAPSTPAAPAAGSAPVKRTGGRVGCGCGCGPGGGGR